MISSVKSMYAVIEMSSLVERWWQTYQDEKMSITIIAMGCSDAMVRSSQNKVCDSPAIWAFEVCLESSFIGMKPCSSELRKSECLTFFFLMFNAIMQLTRHTSRQKNFRSWCQMWIDVMFFDFTSFREDFMISSYLILSSEELMCGQRAPEWTEKAR